MGGVAPNLEHFKTNEIDWKSIYRIANDQAVTVVVSDGIETLPEELWPPTGAIYKFAMSRIKTTQMHELLNSTLNQIVYALESEGVNSVLLKGQGVAQNYRIPVSRSCGDLDIYTGEAGYKRAFEIIETLQGDKPHREAAECIHHLHTSLNGVEVEIHRQASIVYGKRIDPSKTPYLIGKWRSMTYQTKRLLRLFHMFSGYSTVYLWHWFTGTVVRFVS